MVSGDYHELGTQGQAAHEHLDGVGNVQDPITCWKEVPSGRYKEHAPLQHNCSTLLPVEPGRKEGEGTVCGETTTGLLEEGRLILQQSCTGVVCQVQNTQGGSEQGQPP